MLLYTWVMRDSESGSEFFVDSTTRRKILTHTCTFSYKPYVYKLLG